MTSVSHSIVLFYEKLFARIKDYFEMEDKKGLLLLFQRPLEPVFTPKDDGKAAFDLPESYLTDRYKNVGTEIENRFGSEVETKVNLKKVINIQLNSEIHMLQTTSRYHFKISRNPIFLSQKV